MVKAKHKYFIANSCINLPASGVSHKMTEAPPTRVRIFFHLQHNSFYTIRLRRIDDYAKDVGEELFTKTRCALRSNSYRIVKDP